MTIMVKKKILKLVGVAALLVLLAGYFFWRNNAALKIEPDQIVIRGHIFKIETVVSESAKEKGLGGRQSICADCGMLFVFDKPGKYGFWMKDMQFALDLLWLKDGRVIFLKKNIAPSFMQTMLPAEKADRVLELNAGTVDKLGIAVGDQISGAGSRSYAN